MVVVVAAVMVCLSVKEWTSVVARRQEWELSQKGYGCCQCYAIVPEWVVGDDAELSDQGGGGRVVIDL
jgi:hypothetical protein